MDPTLPAEATLNITWWAIIIGGVASFIRMLMVNGIIQGWKAIFDTDIDPKTGKPIEIYTETTTRGVAAVTQDDLDEFQASNTTTVLSPSKKRVFKRPLWFSKLLPALPWFHGILFGIVLGVPLTLWMGVVPMKHAAYLVLFHGVVGFGEGGSAHLIWRAFDNNGGYDGLIAWAKARIDWKVKNKTGEANTVEPPKPPENPDEG